MDPTTEGLMAVFEKGQTKMVALVMDRLADLNLWIYHDTGHGAVYIKFENPRLGSLRISDHAGKFKDTYHYRWNLRKDLKGRSVSYPGHGRVRYFYGWDQWEKLCRHIESQAVMVS